MTFAFNIDEVFQQVLSRENDVLRYVVKDDPLGEEESIGQDHDVIFASGGYLGEGALANFLRERSNPLNRNRYIHNKFMLVDPLSEDPLSRHRFGELQQALAAHQRREHARHPRRQARGGHLLRRVYARLRPSLCALHRAASHRRGTLRS